MIIGKIEDQVSFIYTDPIWLVSEIDCVRVIGAFSNDMLQLVPHYVQEIFRINSTSPSSYLVEASKQFEVIHVNKYFIYIYISKICFFLCLETKPSS
jgi:hypothetical protein